jgi:hypothetical protein
MMGPHGPPPPKLPKGLEAEDEEKKGACGEGEEARADRGREALAAAAGKGWLFERLLAFSEEGTDPTEKALRFAEEEEEDKAPNSLGSGALEALARFCIV